MPDGVSARGFGYRVGMHHLRAFILLAAVLFLAGCGSGDDSSADTTPKRDAGASNDVDTTETQPKPRVASSSFVETAAIRTCLERAEFVKRASPAGGIVAWSGPSGTIVIANEPQLDRVLGALANARVIADTNIVVSGDSAELDAAVACLRTPKQ
ncbi:MAG: hypothetical protein JWM90_141 [Thermoleophilia bacterium]|nr:hypothetical protein [Thermoleophilia bacterium]